MIDLLHLDARSIEPQHRYEWWEQCLTSAMYPVLVRPPGSAPRGFDARFVAARLGETTLSQGAVDPIETTISAQAAAAAPADTVQLTVTTRHSRQLNVRGDWLELPAGSLIVHDATVACTHRAANRDSLTMLTVPRAALSLAGAQLNDLMLRALTIDEVSLRTMRQSVANVLDPAANFSPLAAQSYLIGTADLVLRTVSGRDGDHAGTSEARRQQVLDYVRAHACEPGLTVADVAADLNVSIRRVQQLFADQGGVAAVVRRLRIERATVLLTDPALSTLSIERVGARCGFADRSAFSRAYLAVTGRRPSDDRSG